MYRSALLLAALPLAACGGAGTGTSISINAQSDEDNSTLSTDGNGEVAIKVPGFEGALKLPPIDISAEDFEVDGLRLYPHSKIHSFQADAQDRRGEKDHGKVVVAFDSPASLAKVQGWFRDNLAKRGFKTSADGNGFKGTTEDGDPFVLTLDAAGADKVSGKMEVGN